MMPRNLQFRGIFYLTLIIEIVLNYTLHLNESLAKAL